jgi:transcription elongation factor Elf1
MIQLQDHPDIRRAMRTGRPTADDGLTYRCPVCGDEIEADTTVYRTTRYGKEITVGCERCIEVRTAEGIYA